MATHLTENKIDAAAGPAGRDLLNHGAAVASKWPALFATMLGVVMIFGVGFSNLNVAHNAAHDTRHAMAFPCH